MAATDTTNPPASKPEEPTVVDVIIVGAGVSGINTAYRVQESGLVNSYVILEGRDDIGGTWDLFKYPGIRSDSDILTFGFPWNPWPGRETLAAGPAIKSYVKGSARKFGIDRRIRFRHKVVGAEWRSSSSDWTLDVLDEGTGTHKTFKGRFFVLGTGYYDYETPRQTVIPGIENFKGPVVHPQHWPEDFDYRDRNVVLIGSGATAVTLLPAMADKARHIIMLQRSPSYVTAIPNEDTVNRVIRFLLPGFLAPRVCRLYNVLRMYLLWLYCTTYPEPAKKGLAEATMKELPPDIPWDPHFKPRYDPWQQRLCVAPRGDFFAALRAGKASVVTDTIDKVTDKTIELTSGRTLHPDAIITATGLKIKFAGGIPLTVDGRAIDISDKFVWKSSMLQDVPNCFLMMGYDNASWTLGAEATAHLMVRLMRTMKQKGASKAMPYIEEPTKMASKPLLSLASTYLQNAARLFPKTGTGQWASRSNYFSDLYAAKWGDIMTGLRVQ